MLSGAVAERRTSLFPGFRHARVDSAVPCKLDSDSSDPQGPSHLILDQGGEGPTVLHLWSPANTPVGGQPRHHSSTNCPHTYQSSPHGTGHASFKSTTMTSMRQGKGRDFLPSSPMTPSSTRHELDLVPKRQTQAFIV